MTFESEMLACRPQLWKVAMRLTHSETEAEDLVQTTLLQALEKRHLFLAGSNLIAWLTVICRHLHYGRWRKRKYWADDADGLILAAAVDERTGNPDSAIELRQVLAALDRLGPDARAITLEIADGLGYDEVAALHGLPVGTVKSRLHRIRHKLMGQA